MFQGSFVALVTPFKDGSVDWDTLKDLVDFHIANGTNGLVPCGTTGESATLSSDEHEQVIDTVIQQAAGRIPVIAGTGSNNTAEAIRLTKHAAKSGADAVLLINPYYNKPTQEGLYLHFKALAESVDIPIILYNISSRTGVNMLPETVARLRKDFPTIVGIKEASGNIDQMSTVMGLCDDEFIMLSGDDALTLPLLSLGARGVISVVANIVPQDVSALVSDFFTSDLTGARARHYKLAPLVKAMFYETNPIPVKTAMGILGMISPSLRLPMSPLSAENTKKLKAAMAAYGLIGEKV